MRTLAPDEFDRVYGGLTPPDAPASVVVFGPAPLPQPSGGGKFRIGVQEPFCPAPTPPAIA